MNDRKRPTKGRIILIVCVVIFAMLFIFFSPERTSQSKSPHFTFHFTTTISTWKINLLAAALEENYQRIGNALRTKPAENIEVNVYAQRWRYIKATGNWGASGNIEGTNKLHFVEQAWGEKDSKKVAVHEFAHTVTLKLLIENEPAPVDSKIFDKKFMSFPVWLWEGISVYEAGQFVDPKSLPFLSNGAYPAIPELNSRIKGGKIYKLGYVIIEYILNKYGQDKLIELIKNYGDLSKTLGVTDDEFCKDWSEFVKARYLK